MPQRIKLPLVSVAAKNVPNVAGVNTDECIAIENPSEPKFRGIFVDGECFALVTDSADAPKSFLEKALTKKAALVVRAAFLEKDSLKLRLFACQLHENFHVFS